MIFYLLGLLGYYKAMKKPVPAGICLLFFFVMAVPPVTSLYLLLFKHWVFQIIAFVAGWFCWTFIEYFIRRFWLHRKENADYHNSNYFFHHTKPQQIFTAAVKRLIILSFALLLIFFSFSISVYLLLPAGIFTGYALYGYMHVWIYKPWAVRWFRKLREFHMQHHCGHTEKCFGVTVTWWDRLFNTIPHSEKIISRTAGIRVVSSGGKRFILNGNKEKFKETVLVLTGLKKKKVENNYTEPNLLIKQ